VWLLGIAYVFRNKKKIGVPVVELGKVGKGAKWFYGRGLGGGRVF
jgi:hypothetical protein